MKHIWQLFVTYLLTVCSGYGLLYVYNYVRVYTNGPEQLLSWSTVVILPVCAVLAIRLALKLSRKHHLKTWAVCLAGAAFWGIANWLIGVLLISELRIMPYIHGTMLDNVYDAFWFFGNFFPAAALLIAAIVKAVQAGNHSANENRENQSS